MRKKLPSSWLSVLKKTFNPSSKKSPKLPQQAKARDKNSWTLCINSRETNTSRSMTGTSQTGKLPHPHSKISFHIINNTQLVEAAMKIQAAFRGFLARRALRSLKALVKIQALVRGNYIRRRAEVTMQCMKSLIRIQERILRQRLMSLEMRKGFTANKNQRNSKHYGDAAESKCIISSSKTLPTLYGKELSEAISRLSSLEPSNYPNHPQLYPHQSPAELYSSESLPSHILCSNPATWYSSYRQERIDEGGQVPVCRHGLSSSTPPTPNYMAFTECFKAKVRSQIRDSTATKRVSFEDTDSASNPPSLQSKNFLPPIRTERPRFSLTESYGGETAPFSAGKFRRFRYGLVQGPTNRVSSLSLKHES